MAEAGLKDFSVNWVQFGLLFFCLMSFAVAFMATNNSGGLGEEMDRVFSRSITNFNNSLTQTGEDSDTLLNITANTNPEDSYLGSRDSVATSYGVTGISGGFFTKFKIFLKWIMSGEVGNMLLSVFGGLFGLMSLYYIYKWIRTGT